jgi:hypothetical protein
MKTIVWDFRYAIEDFNKKRIVDTLFIQFLDEEHITGEFLYGR